MSDVEHLIVRELGRRPYRPVWEAMAAFTERRDGSTIDEFWLVQHPPVFTLGQAGKAAHVLAAGDIPVVQVDRGGQVTYHGPGQQILYLLVNIRRKGFGVRKLVSLMEQAVIDTLAEFGIASCARADAPGVYVRGAKIAALGLRIRRGCSFHGLALNVDLDLAPFQRINPCGYAGMAVTRMRDFIPDITVDGVQKTLIRHLAELTGYSAVSYAGDEAGLPGTTDDHLIHHLHHPLAEDSICHE